MPTEDQATYWRIEFEKADRKWKELDKELDRYKQWRHDLQQKFLEDRRESRRQADLKAAESTVAWERDCLKKYVEELKSQLNLERDSLTDASKELWSQFHQLAQVTDENKALKTERDHWKQQAEYYKSCLPEAVRWQERCVALERRLDATEKDLQEALTRLEGE
jgi:chromosome segregation ATPase